MIESTQQESTTIQRLPVLPLRDVVVYPYMVIPLFVGRVKSTRALETAMNDDKQILLVTQKNAADDDPKASELFEVGALATILQMLKLPDGTVKVLVEGNRRAKVIQFYDEPDLLTADIELLDTVGIFDNESEILMRSVITQFEQYVKMNKKIPPEILTALAGVDDSERVADTIAAHLTVKLEEKQHLLELVSLNERLERILVLLESEIDLLRVENRIRGRVKGQMEKSQREYYLNEQMKAIQKELGELENAPNEMEELEKKVETVGLSDEAKGKAKQELNKLKMMPPMSAEATVSRNYLDWMLQVPWKKKSKIHYDLKGARTILDEDHYGLDKIKERMVEFLAVQRRVKKLKGPIICLVGPPGVGKTSLGQSIARSTGRKFVRVSLGGVRDEAEIRGHRRTYIGSMPGKVLQKLAKVGVRNPLFMLDEIDKMAMDFRGDPASALLEVLDPEQNHAFNDHYLEVDYDLSDVMFIATANSMNIPPPLLDRMEVIRISGYTEDEKVHISEQHLIPKEIEQNGLGKDEIRISESALRDMVRYYTREAGVRNLQREISTVCRKVVKEHIEQEKDKTAKAVVTQNNLEKYLGVKKFRFGLAEQENRVGQVNGLAWTEVGGELLTIETVAVKGKGNTSYTGQLGEIMQESIKAAMTCVRSRCEMLGIEFDFYEKYDIHVHVPEGATPKDGPSAGISMCTALVSALTKIPVRADVAMTGEITLRGEVLPIGGLKEKLLAALRAGIKKVIIPYENERDLKEIPKNIKKGLDIHPVRWIDEVLSLALQEMSKPKKTKKARTEVAAVKPPLENKRKQKPESNEEERRH